ncbi:MAG: LysM peptidoglycan-binding domain-containing protein [Paraglaciecola sp.]|nr:LysM peptidoglycan-binding domain-containing protein [Paraglaciecola sp.]NCT49800.1 LysM peptidoglycan-binding domain-containing protein [Paraglaciecola sp.]
MNHKYRVFFLLILMLVPSLSWADVITIKADAPQKYVVQKGDTLWDISRMYLDKPWLWPELWRTNTHIQNPHLIYPGDELNLIKNAQGDLVLSLVRETAKAEIKLTPQGTKTEKTPTAIPALPWSTIKPFIENDQIMQTMEYNGLPQILGNQDGAVMFATSNITLSKATWSASGDLRVLRKQNDIFDMNGNFVGVQVRHVADAKVIDSSLDKQSLIKIEQASYEVKRGDKLAPTEENQPTVIELSAADTQRGFIIDDLEQHSLLGKFNVVIIDLGANAVSLGTVMGIYAQGPAIIDEEQPKYVGENNALASAFSLNENIIQPALKVGELVVFKVFDKASYALITRSSTVISRGAIVANP